MKTKRLARQITAFLVILLAFTQAGCWSQIETENLAVVTAIALDKTTDGKTRVAVEIVRPAVITGASAIEGGGGEGAQGTAQPVLQIGSTGETPYDAWRNLELQMSRMMFFAHTKHIIIGEKLAREGISPYLDFAERRFRLRRNVGLSVTPGEAKDVLVATPLLEPTIGLDINSLGKNRIRQSKAPLSTLGSFFQELLSETTHPTTTKINVFLLDPETGHRHVKLAGTAVFKNDKLIGWLNETETRGLNRILGEMGRGTIPVRCPGGGDASIVTERSSTEITPVIRDGKPVIQIKVSEEGETGDQECPVNLATPEGIAALNEAYAEAIREEVEAVVLAAQQVYGVDILGFGEAFRRKHNRFWKEKNLKENWAGIFPNVPVELAVEANVRRVGLTLAPTTVK